MTAAESYGDASTDARRIVEALADACQKCKRAVTKGAGDVHCPAHDDAAPSLSMSVGRNGVVVNCHTGCSQDAVIAELRKLGLWPDVKPAAANVQRWAYSRDGAVVARHCRQDRPGQPKRYWWELPDGTTSHGDVQEPSLPLYGLDRLAAHPDDAVLFCEGEKAADAGTLRGFLTVSLGGGAGQKDFGAALQALAGRRVVLLPDNDLPGRDFMRRVESSVRGIAASVRLLPLPGLPVKGDLFDYFADGGSTKELQALIDAPALPAPQNVPALAALPTPRRLRDLLAQTLPPIHYAVEGILPEGVTLCAGGPKLGKSFLALNLALAVSAGGKALGDLAVEQGDVLYLCLEGGEHSIYDRAKTMLAGDACPEGLYFETEWPLLTEGGADGIARWMETTPSARLVIVDTLQKVRPPTNSKQGGYEQDYAALQSLMQLSHKHHVPVIVVHHTNKAGHDDPINRVSGTTGLTGAVDTIWIFQRVRGEGAASVSVSGRMCPELDLGLEWDDALLCWRHVGDAADVRRSHERRAILAVLAQEREPLDARGVATLVEKDYEAVRKLLWLMERSGELLKRGGGYVAADREPGRPTRTYINEVHNGHSVDNEDSVHTVHNTLPSGHVLGTVNVKVRAGARGSAPARDSLLGEGENGDDVARTGGRGATTDDAPGGSPRDAEHPDADAEPPLDSGRGTTPVLSERDVGAAGRAAGTTTNTAGLPASGLADRGGMGSSGASDLLRTAAVPARGSLPSDDPMPPTRPGFLRLSVATKSDCCGQPGFWMADDTRRVYCPVHVPPSKPLEESP